MTEAIDTGFGDVLAGEVYVHPDPTTVAEQITVAVNQCDSSSAVVPAPSPQSVDAPTANSGLTSAGIQAAKALVQLPALSWPELSKLAMDVAMNIKQMPVILSENKLTQQQYDFLETYNEFYRNALTEACRQWHAPLSVQERLKVEAAAILEDSLLGLGARMQNRAEGLPGVIEAAKFFAKVAGAGEQAGGNIPTGERFVINIDLGGDQKVSVAVGGSPDPMPAPAGVLAISSDGKGPGG